MLSKSAAKWFFIIGTGVCAGAFGLLTIDTIQRVPAQTNSQNITPEVAHGKELWESNNCMGCHTLFGEGAYYAPELTKVYTRRGPEFIRSMLRDPAKMYPGERRMQQYDFNETEIEALVAFFKWSGEVDLNGFPVKTVAEEMAEKQKASAGHVASPQIFQQMCVACHSIAGSGGNVGPALDGVATRYDSDYLKRWLMDPLSVKPDSKMPKLPLSDEDLEALVTYLSQLK